MTNKGHALSRDALIRTLTAYSGITTADGAFDGTATLIDSNLKGRNDFITEKTILIMSGDAKDEDKGATAFDKTDGKITLQGTGFSHKIKAGTIFRVLNISTVEMDVANIAADIDTLLTRVTAAVALEATLTAIKGAGWTDENLTTIDGLIDAIKAVTDALPDAGALTALLADIAPKVMGRSQVFEKSITSAANAGDVTVATITTQPCLIESVVIHADTAQPAHMTSCGVFGGAEKVVTFIAAADAAQADLNAADKQVPWTGAVRLATDKTIVIDLQGTGTDPVDLTIIIKYRACVSGGYLA